MEQAEAGSRAEEDGGDSPVLPTSCPYCGKTLRAQAHKNGTIELRCVQIQEEETHQAHGMIMYVKPRKKR